MRQFLCFLIVLFFGTFSARAASIELGLTPRGQAYITIVGEFVLGDEKKFNNLAIGLEEAVVFLASPGGMTDPAMKIGESIRIKGFSTAVFQGQTCASACALIWLAGKNRLLHPTSRVGFHAVYVTTNGQQDVSAAGNAIVGAYLQKFGFSQDVIIYVTMASPNSMNWLTEADAKSIGLEIAIIDDQPVPHGTDAAPNDDSLAPSTSQQTEVTTPQYQAPPRSWMQLEYSDLPGYDLPDMPIRTASPFECQSNCEKSSQCVAFTYNAEHGVCFLKSHAFEALQYSGAVSGYDALRVRVQKLGGDYTLDPNFRTSKGLEILAPMLRAFSNATLDWCQNKCLTEAKCSAFNLYPSGECRLLRASKPTRRRAEIYSGFKSKH